MSRAASIVACTLLFALISGYTTRAQAPCEKRQAACSAACPASEGFFHCDDTSYSCSCGQVRARSNHNIPLRETPTR